MTKITLDDGSFPYLTEGASFVGSAGIPCLMNINNIQIPKSIISFDKIKREKNKFQYVHFYMHDKYFNFILKNAYKYVDILHQYDGILTPDFTLMVNQSLCIQQMNTYYNRAIGYYFQKQGIPVIPNIRWSDERSFDFCFLGVPKNSVVSVSTHGCIKSKRSKELFKIGMREMINVLKPKDVLVHGYMPKQVFDDFSDDTIFHRYPSLFELTHHKQKEKTNGNRI
ncbi:MAG: DUF4417 domain-containing protein [Succinivibrionaceae bacterium]